MNYISPTQHACSIESDLRSGFEIAADHVDDNKETLR
jgi:hypothetical protein